MSDKELQTARDAAAYGAWLDIFSRFDAGQRKDLANLFAHDWTISAIELQSRHGGDPERRVASIPIETALKANHARLERQRPARLRIYKDAKP